MQTRSLVLYGGSFNPPTRAHQVLARQLVSQFNRTVVVPCGLRPDKATTNVVGPAHRAWMIRHAFCGVPIELDFSDLERDQFTRTIDLDRQWRKRVGADVSVWHVMGSDLIRNGATGRSDIHTWEDGDRLWNTLNFVICRAASSAVATPSRGTTRKKRHGK